MDKVTIGQHEGLDLHTLQVVRHLLAGRIRNAQTSTKLIKKGITKSTITGEEFIDSIADDLKEVNEFLNSF